MRLAACLLVALAAAACEPGDDGGDGDAVRRLISFYGCSTCHRMPGGTGFGGATGPPLTAVARQIYIAGIAPNTPENLAIFIADPQRIDPRSAMPNLGVPAADAAALAAHLLSSGEGR